MRAIGRRTLPLVCLGALAASLAASAPERPTDAVAALASALSDGDAAAFLGRIDEKTPGYADLARNVRSLLAGGPVSSSIDPVADEGNDERHSMRLNWILGIAGVERRGTVQCDVERRGDKWYVTRLEPASFFAPRD